MVLMRGYFDARRETLSVTALDELVTNSIWTGRLGLQTTNCRTRADSDSSIGC